MLAAYGSLFVTKGPESEIHFVFARLWPLTKSSGLILVYRYFKNWTCYHHQSLFTLHDNPISVHCLNTKSIITCLWCCIVSLQLKNAVPHESSCEMTLNCIANDIISCFLVSSAPDLNHCESLYVNVTCIWHKHTLVCFVLFSSICCLGDHSDTKAASFRTLSSITCKSTGMF